MSKEFFDKDSFNCFFHCVELAWVVVHSKQADEINGCQPIFFGKLAFKGFEECVLLIYRKTEDCFGKFVGSHDCSPFNVGAVLLSGYNITHGIENVKREFQDFSKNFQKGRFVTSCDYIIWNVTILSVKI